MKFYSEIDNLFTNATLLHFCSSVERVFGWGAEEPGLIPGEGEIFFTSISFKEEMRQMEKHKTATARVIPRSLANGRRPKPLQAKFKTLHQIAH